MTFTWSSENRLTGINVNSGAKTATLDYDASGRVVRISTNAFGRYYVWDGDQLLAELNSDDGATLAEYSWYGPDRPHAIRRAGTTYWAHSDGLGNVIALTNASTKAVARTYGYDQWGQVTSGTGAVADGVRWKGAWAPLHAWSEVADLYFLRARWYEGMTGRFLSEDPIGLEGGINPYLFAGGDPVNGFDPSGLDWACLPMGEAGDWQVTYECGWWPFGGGGGGGGGFSWNDVGGAFANFIGVGGAIYDASGGRGDYRAEYTDFWADPETPQFALAAAWGGAVCGGSLYGTWGGAVATRALITAIPTRLARTAPVGLANAAAVYGERARQNGLRLGMAGAAAAHDWPVTVTQGTLQSLGGAPPGVVETALSFIGPLGVLFGIKDVLRFCR